MGLSWSSIQIGTWNDGDIRAESTRNSNGVGCQVRPGEDASEHQRAEAGGAHGVDPWGVVDLAELYPDGKEEGQERAAADL